MSTRKAQVQSGFSLIELIVFIVIVSTALAGVLSVMNFTTAHSADPVLRKQALAIAESMLEEVELKDFAPPAGGFTGPYTQANRQYFDDIGDYNNFPPPGPGIDDITGVAVPGLEAYSVAVTVASAALGSITAASNEAKIITVTVTDLAGGQIKLSGYRAHYGS